MKVSSPRALMLTPDEGYLDRRIAQEAATLAADGWSVDIYAAVDPHLRWQEELPTGVRLLRPSTPPRSTPRGFVAMRAAKHAVERVLPAVGRLSDALQYRHRDIAGEITSSRRNSLTGRGPYELVVAHDIPVLPLAVELQAAWASVLICDVHELFPEQTLWIKSDAGRSYWRALENRYFPRCDGLMAVNDGVGEYVTERAPGKPVVTVQNTVPFMERRSLERGDVRDLYPIRSGTKVMVWAGTLRPETNLKTVITGFVEAALDGWALAIVGDGPLRPELERLVERSGAEDRVFVGQRAAQPDLIPMLASAQIGVLSYQASSLNLAVATPNKLYEYIQARLPIATSRLPQVARVIDHYANGTYVDFSNAASTREGLRRIADEHSEITEGALERVAMELSWERDAVRMTTLIDELRRAPRA